MNRPDEVVIKTSPFVFLKRLVIIELILALISLAFFYGFNLPQLYAAAQLDAIASFRVGAGLILAAFQILIIALAFLTWYGDAYLVDREKIMRRQGFFGARELARTQTISEVEVIRPRLGETFNYGALRLKTIHGTGAELKNIPNPVHYADLIKTLITPLQIDVGREINKSIPELISGGEGQYLEFKSSFSWDYRRQRINKELNKAVMKNVVAFMNTTGGILLIGVDDEGQILGLEPDLQSLGKSNVDGFENVFNTAFRNMVGLENRPYLSLDFVEIDGKTICRLVVLPAPEPVYLTHGNAEEFYIRTGNSSHALTISQAIKYVQTHFLAA